MAVTRLYIAGKMTGLPEYGYPAFFEASHALDDAGYQVESPTAGGQVDGWAWGDYMRRGLRQLLDCDGIAVLENWSDSRGATVEVTLALELGMPVRPVEAWLELAEQAGGSCSRCGNDEPAEGYPWCTECMEAEPHAREIAYPIVVPPV